MNEQRESPAFRAFLRQANAASKSGLQGPRLKFNSSQVSTHSAGCSGSQTSVFVTSHHSSQAVGASGYCP